MLFDRANLSLILSGTALALVVYSTLFSDLAVDSEVTQPRVESQVTVQDWDDSSSYDKVDLNTEILELRRYILDLEERINDLQYGGSSTVQANLQGGFKEAVLEVIADKEEAERKKIREQNPMYGFYEDLPEDYEIRIKTDPDYARQVGKELKSKILNENLSETERLAAMSQMQMTMFMLNRTEMPEYDYEAVDAILKIGKNSNDDKVKIQALEVVAHTPVADPRVSDSFISMLEKEQNDYIRSMAAEGLIAQYYNSQGKESEFAKKVAQDILGLYDHSSDAKLKQLLETMIGDDRMLEELRNVANP